VLLATGVNAEGYREILGLQTSSTEDGAGWLTFFRDLVARGLSGVKLVTSDAHAGLVAAAGATLPGAGWQRCRTHYAANLMATTPKSSWPWVKTLLQTVFDQPDADAVHTPNDPMRAGADYVVRPFLACLERSARLGDGQLVERRSKPDSAFRERRTCHGARGRDEGDRRPRPPKLRFPEASSSPELTPGDRPTGMRASQVVPPTAH
jgi:hypothetical protein